MGRSTDKKLRIGVVHLICFQNIIFFQVKCLVLTYFFDITIFKWTQCTESLHVFDVEIKNNKNHHIFWSFFLIFFVNVNDIFQTVSDIFQNVNDICQACQWHFPLVSWHYFCLSLTFEKCSRYVFYWFHVFVAIGFDIFLLNKCAYCFCWFSNKIFYYYFIFYGFVYFYNVFNNLFFGVIFLCVISPSLIWIYI